MGDGILIATANRLLVTKFFYLLAAGIPFGTLEKTPREEPLWVGWTLPFRPPALFTHRKKTPILANAVLCVCKL